MCGICGAINSGSRLVNESQLKRMVSVIRHRGPDQAGIVSDGNVLLGHARLSIIDLSGGAQPMPSHDGRYELVFNGEIYNYIELRQDLEAAGAVFKTSSDTEVIIEAYRAWGTACLNRFNGQWAFALWDVKENKVLISRDRVGIRPLYYTQIGRAVLFASEIKALFAHPDVPREFSPAGISQAFTFWSPVAPNTVFKNIRQLPPGGFAEINTADGRMETQQYWQLTFGKDTEIRNASFSDNKELFKEKLVEASRLRFDRSDVPVGAYLSGGIDSTVTTAVLSKYTDATLKTFSVAFSDSEFDESAYQDLVAERLGTDHERIIVDAKDIGRNFPDVIWHGEQPILRTAPCPLFLLSGLVRSAGFKVVVTGEGSDEMLAGYDIFREAFVRRIVAENPDRNDHEELVKKLYPWMHRSPAKTPAFAKAFFAQDSDINDIGFSHRPRWNASSNILQFISPDFAVPSGAETAADYLSSLPVDLGNIHPLEQAQYLEISTLLAGYILAPQGDRMLMGHSVEGRFPFLDHNIMEFAASLPPEHKLHELNEKHILKEAFADMIPQEVIDRPKQPYRAPDASSFFANGSSPEWLQDVMSESALKTAGIFNPLMVSGLMKKCSKTNGMNMSNTDNMRIVAVASTMILYDKFIKGASQLRQEYDDRDIRVRKTGRGV